MGTELFLLAVVLLAGLAIFDLVVGVSNDAVNFLNSSIGSRVAPRYVILLIASLGIVAGVTFSGGMMEVARKGIFHPQFFTMPELITIFLAVMLTDLVLLDLFNTFGLPTSTTVSIVFELLGAAMAVSVLKILEQGDGLATLGQYINSSKALIIILGILLSVVVAFLCGAVAQFFTRLLFTFDYAKRLARYGALWGGVALSSITYFILVKGAKGATFITPETADWIRGHTFTILLSIFAVSAVLLQLLLFTKTNVLKPVILIGTFALAMAFAANDLMNFIGVPMAGYHSYQAAMATDNPLTGSMEVLGGKVATETYLLLIAGLVMVVTLWVSKKARTVSETELSIAHREEGVEKFESALLSRVIVRMALGCFDGLKRVIPSSLIRAGARRMDPAGFSGELNEEKRPSFDLLRASVNLMVASAVISYATSQKLPLSTTYVTFMVSMGTSFADLAWGRDSAVYRITGVLTVVGGWFMTAMMAFSISGLCAVLIYHTGAVGVGILLAIGGLAIWKNHGRHKERARLSKQDQIFNLKKVTSVPDTLSATFEHMAKLIREIRLSLDISLKALFQQNEYVLSTERKKARKIQNWANIIIANIFKAMRLLQKEHEAFSYLYGPTIRRIQKLADGHRDIVARSYQHVSNQHKGLLDEQIEEMKKVWEILNEILLEVESTFDRKLKANHTSVFEKDKQLRKLAEQLSQAQVNRIHNETSKTRLTILYYAIIGNAMMLSKQNLKLLEIFQESFGNAANTTDFDLD